MTNKTYAELKEIIAEFQAKLPVDVEAIAKVLKISTYREHGWPKNLSGKILKDRVNGGASGYAIYINADHSPTRQRFTLAHEIAHFIHHRDSIGDGISDDALYRSGLSNGQEIMANTLAAEILMPTALVNQQLKEGISSIKELADIFEVSQTAMAIRLGVPSET